jgi:perosamine synthetase
VIPYGRQTIDEDDIKAVVDVLRSDWLTTGPKVAEFEQAVADYVGAKYAVAVSSGTAALHAAMYAIGIKPGDEVIVSPITFAATANCVVYQGGTPVFADVDPGTLLLDPAKVEEKITEKTKAIIGVDYAGHPCDWERLRDIADRYRLRLVADGCHALGAEYKDRKVGSLADMTIFSFHPVKHITTGEGGMITTDDPELAGRMRLFRTHGITRDPKCFSSPSSDLRPQTSDFSWFYEMTDLGYNYRITDFQCALGISQLRKLPKFLERRREIAALYDEGLADMPGIKALGLRSDVLPASQSVKRQAQSEGKEGSPSDSTLCSTLYALRSTHAYHLYVVRVDSGALGIDRTSLFTNLREKGIGVNVHYIPVHLHPFYRGKFHTGTGLCPVAEAAYKQIISLPIFPCMTDIDVENVIVAVLEVLEA